MIQPGRLSYVGFSLLIVVGTVRGQEPLRIEASQSHLVTLAFAPDGNTLATGGYDRVIKLWDADTGKLRVEFKGHKDWVLRLAFTPDGETLASAGADHALKLWDVKTGRERATRDQWSTLELAISPDGKSLTCGAPDGVSVCDLASGNVISTHRGHSDIVGSVTFSSDGKLLASASNDKTARVWGLDSDRPKATLSGHTGHVTGVAFAPDSKTLATVGADRTVRLWNLGTGKEKARFEHDEDLFSVAISPDRKMLAVGGRGRALILDPVTLQCRATLECGVPLASDREGAIYAVEFSRDAKKLAAANALGNAWIWNTVDIPITPGKSD